MHGYEPLAELRADPRMTPVPVVVCSSRTSDKHRERAERAAATAYLLKISAPTASDCCWRQDLAEREADPTIFRIAQ